MNDSSKRQFAVVPPQLKPPPAGKRYSDFPAQEKSPFRGFCGGLKQRGPVGVWQRYEEATMCQRRPADPTDPGDAADLSIMGYF
jgi:hypothetical protein